MQKYLYLITCQNLYKIGVANDVFSRLASLQTGNPFPLSISACYEFNNAEVVERALHEKYSGRRMRGEWFDLSQRDIRQLETICKLMNGKLVEIKNTADEKEVAVAEKEQEIFADYRIEKRVVNGKIRGFVFRSRGAGREVMKYIGIRANREEFMELLAQEDKPTEEKTE